MMNQQVEDSEFSFRESYKLVRQNIKNTNVIRPRQLDTIQQKIVGYIGEYGYLTQAMIKKLLTLDSKHTINVKVELIELCKNGILSEWSKDIEDKTICFQNMTFYTVQTNKVARFLLKDSSQLLKGNCIEDSEEVKRILMELIVNQWHVDIFVDYNNLCLKHAIKRTKEGLRYSSITFQKGFKDKATLIGIAYHDTIAVENVKEIVDHKNLTNLVVDNKKRVVFLCDNSLSGLKQAGLSISHSVLRDYLVLFTTTILMKKEQILDWLYLCDTDNNTFKRHLVSINTDEFKESRCDNG